MEKRYQIFVSSTYEDLREERLRVIQALLEFECIPVGMEFFPAADDTTWEVIKRVIEDCDYYLVIVAGKYGSLSSDGISYTQKEYEYAVEQEIPVITFLHSDPDQIPAGKTELTAESRRKLDVFRTLCRKKMCKSWKTADELAAAVVTSLNQLKRAHPAIGWIRADQLPDTASKEILRLRQRVEELEMEQAKLRTIPPAGTDDLAQGEDLIEIQFNVQMKVSTGVESYNWDYHVYKFNVVRNWNDAFNSIAPSMINEANEVKLKNKIATIVSVDDAHNWVESDDKFMEVLNFNISDDVFDTIIIQLRSLGLIVESLKSRSVKDTRIYWKLTPYGDNLLTKLRAIKRKS